MPRFRLNLVLPLLALLALLALPAPGFLAPAFAQVPASPPQATAPTPDTPRIGLVLGGGGARSFAHVGILQVLEENRIPVHFVAGTSMGAVVGSLYASGRSAGEITRITREIPWTTVFNDSIARERRSFRRKRDDRDVLIDYRISFDDNGLILPKGVLRGQDLFLTLAEILAISRGTPNFDRLPIPYRAVATNIETGQPVVLGQGDIVTAVFASMSVPGGLPPVERDGVLLVDGGIVDNVPIDVARSMGAERLIVVDVGTPLQPRDKLSSFVSVLSQIQLFLGLRNAERQIASLGPADVLIVPEQPDVSTTSFAMAETGITAGRAAATAALPGLRRFSLSPSQWQAHLAARAARMPARAPTLDFVRIENGSDLPDHAITDLVSARAGKPLDAARMTGDLGDVYALGVFRSVRYTFSPSDRPGGEGVTITAEGDPASANWLQLGLGLSTDFNRRTTLRLGIGYTDRNFLDTGLEWRTDLRLGNDLLVQTGLYREFGRTGILPGQAGRAFVEVTPYFSRIDTILYESDRAVSEVRESRAGGRLDGGLLFGNWGELRLGIGIASVDLVTTIGLDLVAFGTLTDTEWRLGFTADTLDNVRFPTRGLLGRISIVDHLSLAGGDFTYAAVQGDIYKPFTWDRTTLLLSGSFGFTSEGDGRSLGDFRLGGFLNLSGLEENQLIGRHKMIARAIVYHRLSEASPLIDLPLYVGGSLEVGNSWIALDDIGFNALRPAGSLFVAADTPLGPLLFAGGLSRGNGAIYLILGRLF